MQTHQLICHIAISFFHSFNTTSCFFSHRNHIVSGIYALGDLCTSPSPRLVSLLKKTLPVSSTNEVRGKHLIFIITPSGILSVFELCYDILFIILCFSLSLYQDNHCCRRKNNFWRHGSKEWSYTSYWQSKPVESFSIVLKGNFESYLLQIAYKLSN